MIYFVQQLETEFIKIGYTKDHKTLKNRAASLQIGNPNKLTIIGTVVGDKDTERLLHALFRDCHIGGEWYKMTDVQIYTLSQFCCKPDHIPKQKKVIDFTKDKDLTAIHRKVMSAVHDR